MTVAMDCGGNTSVAGDTGLTAVVVVKAARTLTEAHLLAHPTPHLAALL